MTSRDDLHRDLAARYLIGRRRFLAMVAATGGVLVLGACSSDGASTPSAGGTDDRPDASGTSKVTDDPIPTADGIDADPFQMGIASGDPLPSSVILWTRLATDLEDATGFGGLGEADHEVRWEVADDEQFNRLVASGNEPALADFGHSVHVDVPDLEPDTWYWYRFRIGDFTSAAGRTRTAPADDATVDELKIAFASCQLRTAGHWTAYPHLTADEPDLVLFLGDYIYEYPGGTGELAIPLAEEPTNLADYRVLYAAYKRDAGLQAAHAVAPWVVTWDDHEVENNYAGSVPEKAADEASFDTRRTAAYQAFWEHHPVRLDPPTADGLVVYRRLRWGTLADVFVLDGRQYRSDQVCGDENLLDRTACPELDDESHTMLGTEQEDWLTSGLESSTATWKVLAQQTVMKALVLGNLVLNVDQWDGYPAARRRLLTHIQDAGVENVVVLTGDIHAGGAADLHHPDATTEGPIVAHELVGTGISSPGLGSLANSLDLSPLGLAYGNFADHGYVRCTITPERWSTDFVIVDTIDTPESAASTDATVEIVAGTPGLRRV